MVLTACLSKQWPCRLLAWSLLISASMIPGAAAGADQEAIDAEGVAFFERRIRPVLVAHCQECHSAESDPVQGGLRLDSRQGLRAGGDSGAVIEAGRPDESLLIQALRYEGLEMPPDGKLPDRVVADFEHWIRIGAPDPRNRPAPVRSSELSIDWQQARSFWAFQPPRAHGLPAVQQTDWPRTWIDHFVLQRMEEAELQPSPPADRTTLIRRLSFDLIGLPPTPEEVAAFVTDRSPRAYEKLVDRLLASPHHGEHQARMWLDLARYAEDQAHIVGDNRSLFYPNAYLYRDWVIDALNADMPYDRFVQLQLAADLLEPQQTELHVALGFLGLGPKYYNRGRLEVKADEWEDRVDVVARGLLGLTAACARCHDHKYDPIPTEDYHALAGIFASTQMFNRPLNEKVEQKDDGQAKDPADALHIVREGEPTDLHVFVRGNVQNRGAQVPRGYLQVLSRPDDSQAFRSGSGRDELARRIADQNNPLTARVLVNRVWGRLIGRPLVDTPSNFGALGQRPTHPQLLDTLAVRFMQQGWSLKWLQRQIVLSATYRQSSAATADQRARDPANVWLSRMHRRRLTVEQWRDAMLLASGRLDRQLGGPSIEPHEPDQRRRTVYSRISRLELNRMLALFDHPDASVHAAVRVQTTTPLQKLFLLNSPWIVQQASRLADAVRPASPESDLTLTERVAQLYRRLYGREASPEELQLARQYLQDHAATPSASWQQLSQALLVANEMFFID